MANGQIQVEIVDTQKCLSAIDEIKKQISEMVGANKVRALLEYADSFILDKCNLAGSGYDKDLLPQNLDQIINDDGYALLLCGVIQEWAELKGYGHSESKSSTTKG